jgi:hypothetical protein
MPRQQTWSGRVLFTSEKPIISVKEARKILGHEYRELSDDNLMGVIVSLTKIAEFYLGFLEVPKSKQVC